MKAVLRETGWDADLAIEPAAAPAAPADDAVTVEVEACGVCGRDCLDRAGRFGFVNLPITPGHEAVGRVIAAGPRATWRVGDRVASMHRDACGDCPACARGETSLCARAASVLGLLVDGGYQRWLTGPSGAFYAVPADMDAALAAVLHCTAGTAWRGLTRAGLARGSRVLVTGANGGVGAAAIQVASRLGATVIAVVRGEPHAALAAELGAAHVLVDDGGGAFHKRLPGGAVDIALDCVGAPTFNSALRSLTVGGRLVAIGNITGERVELNVGYVITYGLQITGSSGATRADMAALLAEHARRPFTIPIHARLPLADADRAQRLVHAGGLRGRIVLVPPA